MSHQITDEMHVLLIDAVVKGYHLCPLILTVRTVEIYSILV